MWLTISIINHWYCLMVKTVYDVSDNVEFVHRNNVFFSAVASAFDERTAASTGGKSREISV